jgi:hypothetical protein
VEHNIVADLTSTVAEGGEMLISRQRCGIWRWFVLVALLAASGCAVLGRGKSTGKTSILIIKDHTYPLIRRLESDSVEVDGVLYRVDSHFEVGSGLWVKTRVVATNRAEETVSSSFTGCQPVVRIYREPRRNGVPVWDETRWLDPPTRCQRQGLGLTLNPGEERVLHTRAVAPLRFRAILPPQSYYFSVVFWVGGQAYEVASGEGRVVDSDSGSG